MRLLATPRNHHHPELVAGSWLLFGSSETVGIELGEGWVNLSVPWTAVNYHLRNLELILEQGYEPQGIVWVMPDPNRVTVFDADPRLIGEVVPLRIERASVSTLYGELVLAGVEAAP
jgi:hypothetical protein